MYVIYKASVKHTLLAAACTFLVLTHQFNNRQNTDRYNITKLKNVLCVYGNLIERPQTAAVCARLPQFCSEMLEECAVIFLK